MLGRVNNMPVDRLRLPIAEASFEKIRLSHKLYVDKTALVGQLVQLDHPILFTRPRRFGKSLLISTFESLFRHGLTHFKGLDIASQWHEGNYPVVRLDFSSLAAFHSYEEFRGPFRSILDSAFSKIGFVFSSQSVSDFIYQLANFIANLPTRSLVLLIDDYDAPLIACLERTLQATLNGRAICPLKSVQAPSILYDVFAQESKTVGQVSYVSGGQR